MIDKHQALITLSEINKSLTELIVEEGMIPPTNMVITVELKHDDKEEGCFCIVSELAVNGKEVNELNTYMSKGDSLSATVGHYTNKAIKKKGL